MAPARAHDKNREAHRLHLHPLALNVLYERCKATGGKGSCFRRRETGERFDSLLRDQGCSGRGDSGAGRRPERLGLARHTPIVCNRTGRGWRIGDRGRCGFKSPSICYAGWRLRRLSAGESVAGASQGDAALGTTACWRHRGTGGRSGGCADAGSHRLIDHAEAVPQYKGWARARPKVGPSQLPRWTHPVNPLLLGTRGDHVASATACGGEGVDGGWNIEIASEIAKSASRSLARDGQKALHNRPHTPDCSRRFYLAVRWSGSWPHTSNAHYGPPACDQGRSGSWLPNSPNYADEQTMRLRTECSPILRSAVGQCWPERGSDYAGDLVGLFSADTTNSSPAVHDRPPRQRSAAR